MLDGDKSGTYIGTARNRKTDCEQFSPHGTVAACRRIGKGPGAVTQVKKSGQRKCDCFGQCAADYQRKAGVFDAARQKQREKENGQKNPCTLCKNLCRRIAPDTAHGGKVAGEAGANRNRGKSQCENPERPHGAHIADQGGSERLRQSKKEDAGSGAKEQCVKRSRTDGGSGSPLIALSQCFRDQTRHGKSDAGSCQRNGKSVDTGQQGIQSHGFRAGFVCNIDIESDSDSPHHQRDCDQQ